MSAESLAKVFSPNLIWKKDLDLMDLSAINDVVKSNDLTHVMIANSDLLFCK